jgi:hypothetical protein
MTRVYCRSPSQMNAFRQSGSSSRATVKRILAGAIHGGADKKVAWAFLTRGTKVGWGRQIDFSSSKNIVFLRYGAEQECSGYLFVLGVLPDTRDKSRSPGFSPGPNFSSSLKFPVFFKGWGRAGMLGLPFTRFTETTANARGTASRTQTAAMLLL